MATPVKGREVINIHIDKDSNTLHLPTVLREILSSATTSVGGTVTFDESYGGMSTNIFAKRLDKGWNIYCLNKNKRRKARADSLEEIL